MQRNCVALATRGAWAAVAVLALTLVPAAKAPAADKPDRVLLPAAGWHGRAIQAPHQHTSTLTSARRSLEGWSAGPVTLGTGLHRPHGSSRVRELQRRLRGLGYRPGEVDGIYGPRTRAAMAWFMRKHGFRAAGPASLAAVAHLRARTTAAKSGPPTPARRGAAQQPTLITARPGAVQRPAQPGAAAGRGTFQWWPWILAALAVAIASGALVALKTPRPAAPNRRRPRALGYIRVAPDHAEATFHACATAIEQECAARGLNLEGLVSDELDDRRGNQRPGLSYTLERLGADSLDCLVVGRIEQLADRQVDLHQVLEQISRRGAVLVVLNVGPHLQPPSRRPTGQAPAPERALEHSDA